MAQGTKIELATRYVSKIEPHTRVLPGAYYEIIDCSDESALCSGCTQADGTAIVYPDIDDSCTIKVKVSMGKSDGGICGNVVNSESQIYYGFSPEYECEEYFVYRCVIQFKDSGDNGNSFVGAAAIYATAYYSRTMFVNNIIDNDAANGDIKVNFYWPSNDVSKFVPKSGQNPSRIEIDGSYFNDDDPDTWNIGYDSVRHQHAHLLHFEMGYEEGYWPGGNPVTGTWHLEKATIPAGTEMEWAFADGFTHFWAALTDVIDHNYVLEDDIVYHIENPLEGTHIETDIWNQIKYSGNALAIRGERIEGYIANLLWDIIDDPSFPDLIPNIDDDALPLQINNLWTVLNIDSVHTILDFWDHSIYQVSFKTIPPLIALEYVFLKNNIGRYQYSSHIDPYTTDDDLQFSYFEIRGMNPNPPVMNQRTLARYCLKNVGQNEIIFEYVDIKYYDENSNLCTFGTNFFNFALDQNEALMEAAAIFVDIDPPPVNPSPSSWSFYPHYRTVDNKESPGDVILQSTDFYYEIFRDNFDGWPNVWIAGEESQSNPTYLWYQVDNWVIGNPCAWCAGIDTNNNKFDPNTNYYHDDQNTYMYFQGQGNWRYIGLVVRFDYWMYVDNQSNDKLILRTWDGTYLYHINEYDSKYNTAKKPEEQRHLKAGDGVFLPITEPVPNMAFKAGDSMRIYFYFVSDSDLRIDVGVFIDGFNLITERPPI